MAIGSSARGWVRSADGSLGTPGRGQDHASRASRALRTWPAMTFPTTGDTRPPPRRSTDVWGSAVMSAWSFSMPWTIFAATFAGGITLIPALTATVSGGFVSFSRANPGVSVSGGYAHDTR